MSIEEHRRLTGQRALLERQALHAFDGRTLPVETTVARRCAALQAPDPKGNRDALIAATALAHGLTFATRDTADFAATGVELVGPFI